MNYFAKAKEYALKHSLHPEIPTGSVVVKNGKIIGRGTNGSDFHVKEGCKRVGYPTGEGYDLCEGCQPHNHGEQKALKGINAYGADLYMWGHWYICKSCKETIETHGIKNIFIQYEIL